MSIGECCVDELCGACSVRWWGRAASLAGGPTDGGAMRRRQALSGAYGSQACAARGASVGDGPPGCVGCAAARATASGGIDTVAVPDRMRVMWARRGRRRRQGTTWGS